MNKRTLGFLLVCFTGPCFGQAREALCPRHIETPAYPSIALTANITGKVTLTMTVDADGKVGDVKATTTESNVSGTRLLEADSVTNIRRWTFAKPPLAPYKQTLVYDYEIDGSLPVDGPATIAFDLPERVTIVASPRSAQPSNSTKKKLKPVLLLDSDPPRPPVDVERCNRKLVRFWIGAANGDYH